jgi:hypothetical protein
MEDLLKEEAGPPRTPLLRSPQRPRAIPQNAGEESERDGRRRRSPASPSVKSSSMAALGSRLDGDGDDELLRRLHLELVLMEPLHLITAVTSKVVPVSVDSPDTA